MVMNKYANHKGLENFLNLSGKELQDKVNIKNREISFNEIKQIFNQNDKIRIIIKPKKELQKNFDEMDLNGDGILSLEEFAQMTKK